MGGGGWGGGGGADKHTKQNRLPQRQQARKQWNLYVLNYFTWM